MDRVVVTRPAIGLFAMQVCCVKDATDEEILTVCNSKNPSGTTHGWVTVVRNDYEFNDWVGKNMAPIQCDVYADRHHIIVLC